MKTLEKEKMHTLLDAVLAANEAGGQARYGFESEASAETLCITLGGDSHSYAFTGTAQPKEQNALYEECMAHLCGLAGGEGGMREEAGQKDPYEAYKETYADLHRLFLKRKAADWAERDCGASAAGAFRNSLHGMLRLLEAAGAISADKRREESERVNANFSTEVHYDPGHAANEEEMRTAPPAMWTATTVCYFVGSVLACASTAVCLYSLFAARGRMFGISLAMCLVSAIILTLTRECRRRNAITRLWNLVRNLYIMAAGFKW